MGIDQIAAANEEAISAWNGVLFERFVEFREIVTTGLGAHGAEAIRCHPPAAGDRVLDIGCGFGDTTQELAALVGPEGSVLGVDAAERFIERSREEAAAAGVSNVSFEVGDVQAMAFEERFDYVFSRMGTMFFANPVAALRNVREAMRPGGRLCMVVWRRKLDNDWMHRAELVVERYLTEPEETDEPRCGPGPFSMADADVTSDIVGHAGFEQVSLRRFDNAIRMGDGLERAIAFLTGLGPAGELIRLAGDDAEPLRASIEADLRVALADFEGPDGVFGPASTWIVSAVAPGSSPPG